MYRRLISALVVGAAIAAMLAVAWGIPTINVGSPLVGHVTTVKAKDLTLVCPGAAFVTGGNSGTNVSSFQRQDSAVVDYSSSLPSGVTIKTTPLTGPAAGHSGLSDTGNQVAAVTTGSALAVTLHDPQAKVEQGSAALTAQSYQILSGKTISGAIGANCQNPATDSWLVGGVTTVGREALLIISNPAATDATVDLQLFGEHGLIDGAGLNGISVSANRTVVLPLAGYAPEQQSLAVHLTSRGAAVATWIQERTVRGTVAAGADLISPSAPAAKNLVIPGLFKRGTKAASALIANNSDYADLTPSIQVFVPGTNAATVTVQVIGVGPKSTGTVLQQQVDAGSTGTFDITGLKDGDYSVFVLSDQPVLASVRLSRTADGASAVPDFAWLPAPAPSIAQLVVTAANSAVSKLSIANGGSATATAVVKDLTTGKSQSVSIPHLGSATVDVTAGDVLGVSADKPVASTLIADFSGQLAAIGLQDYKNSGGRVSVLVK